jgi:hypothetical protein
LLQAGQSSTDSGLDNWGQLLGTDPNSLKAS